MAMKLNQDGVNHARKLIEAGKYVVDSDWSDSQPSASEENKFIKQNGWEAYANWHLAYDPDQNKNTKERYSFPYGDFNKVHRSALNAVQQRAAQNDYNDIEDAGDELVRKIDQKK